MGQSGLGLYAAVLYSWCRTDGQTLSKLLHLIRRVWLIRQALMWLGSWSAPWVRGEAIVIPVSGPYGSRSPTHQLRVRFSDF